MAHGLRDVAAGTPLWDYVFGTIEERKPALQGDDEEAVKTALRLGYRHIDTAERYGNEAAVGEGLQQGLRAAGLDLTLLRPSVIYGEHDRFLNLFAQLQAVFPVMPLAGAQARFQPVWVQDVANAVVHSLRHTGSHRAANVAAAHIFELCGPEVFTLGQLVHNAGVWAGVNEGRGRPVLPLPDWAGRLQALAMECAPGAPLMSRDNLDSMKTANVATGTHLGLAALGIHAAALEPIARAYLNKGRLSQDVLEIRQHHG